MQGTDHIDLTGTVAIVTGGTRGLGRQIALALHGAGAAVTVCGRTEPADLPEGLAFRAADIRD
ncbi:MAG: SDR family NAD(P)-dependent oxidoreductase, partial [Novosphingobium sp.]|nr:SDR family NAD(P)-dependent oxidoreductase [Novosphingobium sp.]